MRRDEALKCILLNKVEASKFVSLIPTDREYNKNFGISPLLHKRYKDKEITFKELEKLHKRQMEARGPHLLKQDMRDVIVVCDCPPLKHKKNCYVNILINFIGSEDVQDFLDEDEDRCPIHKEALYYSDDEKYMLCGHRGCKYKVRI